LEAFIVLKKIIKFRKDFSTPAVNGEFNLSLLLACYPLLFPKKNPIPNSFLILIPGLLFVLFNVVKIFN
jgi:hypothetical protein